MDSKAGMKTVPTPIASAVALMLASMVTCASSPALAQQAAADGQPMEQVVVTGIRASLQQALTRKRNSDTLSEVVSAEDIGKMPDKNVADAIQRVPGVNISSSAGGEGGFAENDRVSIRGTSSSLTQTLVNGHTIGTGATPPPIHTPQNNAHAAPPSHGAPPPLDTARWNRGKPAD